MVFFIDLDDDGDNVKPDRSISLEGISLHAPRGEIPRLAIGPPTFYNSITGAFVCYPIVSIIASAIDLNTLDSLALTCRQIRNGLLQFRTALLASTLRCFNERLPVNPDETFLLRAQARNYWASSGLAGRGSGAELATSKPGPCARDLVGPCRKCGTIVCRNCVIKPPSNASLGERHRRLCQGCTRAPLATLAKPPLDAGTTLSSDTLRMAVCQCESEGVYLCQPCGRRMKVADRNYSRVWRWRALYGRVVGGLGTGIGDGDRGVICGREEECCMARDHEQEIDSAAEDARDAALYDAEQSAAAAGLPGHSSALRSASSQASMCGGSSNADSPRPSPGPQTTAPGYERREIQGIGGVIKKKTIWMVRVGACVPEWEDEKAEPDGLLGREVTGSTRSWCGWCDRVIPGGVTRRLPMGHRGNRG